VSSLIA
jgi:Rab GDP dissociation inhibitor